MTKPKVKITYWNEPPNVEVDPPGSVDLEYVCGLEVSTLVIDYKNVQVYWTWKNAEIFEVMSDNWVSTLPGTDREDEDAFDIRDLPEIPPAVSESYQQLFPDDKIQQQLAYCIDSGWLDDEGLCIPEEVPR